MENVNVPIEDTPKFCPFCQSPDFTKETQYSAEGSWNAVAEKADVEIELQGYLCANKHFFAVELKPQHAQGISMELNFDYYCLDCGARMFAGEDAGIQAIEDHLKHQPDHRIDATISRVL